MNIYIKIGIVGAIVVLSITLLIVYLAIYNKSLNNKNRVKKIRLLDPYKILTLITVIVVFGSLTVFAIPSKKGDLTDGGNSDVGDQERSDNLSGEEEFGVDATLKIYIGVKDFSKGQKDQLNDEISKAGVLARIDYGSMVTDSKHVDLQQYDIVVTKDKITSNIYFDSYQNKKDDFNNMITILQNVFDD